MLKKILLIITNNNFNIFINSLLVCPLMYLIESNWEKYKMIALILTVFIILKNVLILTIQKIVKNNENTKIGIYYIYKYIKLILQFLFFYLQYRYKSFVKFNVWICGIYYFNNLIVLINKILKKNNIIINKFINRDI